VLDLLHEHLGLIVKDAFTDYAEERTADVIAAEEWLFDQGKDDRPAGVGDGIELDPALGRTLAGVSPVTSFDELDRLARRRDRWLVVLAGRRDERGSGGADPPRVTPR
jgi:hypothetical protein